jgi:hypothetical protein
MRVIRVFNIARLGGGLDVGLCIDGEWIQATSFHYDQAWRRGGRRRKFFGFYDPYQLYAAMKADEAMQTEAARRASQ